MVHAVTPLKHLIGRHEEVRLSIADVREGPVLPLLHLAISNGQGNLHVCAVVFISGDEGKKFKGKEAAELTRQIQLRLAGISTYDSDVSAAPSPTVQGGTRIVTTRHRIGQGAFRTLVADAYHRRCAITGERTLPILEAAHIKSFASEGPHSIDNGILLRSDMHALFDTGYLTIDYDSSNEARIVVSPKLHDDFGNGKDYYPYHGRKLAVVPERASLRPAREYLDWHHENVFLG